MTRTRLLLGAAALCSAFIGTAAFAAPVVPMPAASNANVEQVRWVCGPYRCGWRPNYYGYRYHYGYYPHHRWYWRHHHRYWY